MRLSPKAQAALLATLETRFAQNMTRHPDADWIFVRGRLEENPQKLWSLQEMERTGGEPDVISHRPKAGAVVFCDCSPQSPAGRRNLCYDRAALDSRKANKPANSAADMAAAMGIALLDEDDYSHLQTLGAFDTTTSSWIQTPHAVRVLGGALFCDRRYDRVFVYHNGAESYYAARGFRGLLPV